MPSRHIFVIKIEFKSRDSHMKSHSTASSSSSTGSSSRREISAEAWFHAIENKQLELIKKYIAAGFNIYITQPYTGYTAMHYAIESLNPELVQILLNEKFDLNSRFRVHSRFYMGFHTFDHHDGELLPNFDMEEAPQFDPSVIPASVTSTIEVENINVQLKPLSKTPGYLEFFLIVLAKPMIKDCCLETEKKSIVNNIFPPQTNRILDLLLCGGLRLDLPWTPEFQYGMNQLMEAMNYADSATPHPIKLKNLVHDAYSFMPTDTIGQQVKKILMYPIFKAIVFYIDHKLKNYVEPLRAYTNSFYKLKPELYIEAENIKDKKHQFRSAYKAIININRFFPAGVDDIILDYTHDVEKEFMNDRIKNKTSVKF